MDKDPQQPQQLASDHSPLLHALPQSSRRLPGWLISGIYVGSIFIDFFGIGWVALQWTTNNSPASVVAQHFYDAMKKQDYASAYSYLYSSSNLTLQGQSQPITQQSFM